MSGRTLSLVLATAVVAVGAIGTAGASRDSRQATAGFKVGVILPTSSKDLNWSQAMYVAAQQVTQKLGAKLSITDNVFDPTAARPLFNQLLAQHFKLVLAHSFSYAQLVRELAAKNPGTIFVVAADGQKPGKNISIVTNSYAEAGYTQCWLAAKVSKAGIIGNVGASKAPYNVETNQGCAAGAKAANPKAKVLDAFTNDFTDQQKGREVAQSLVDRGADAIFVSGGTDSSLGALALCGQKSVPCFSTDFDNRSVAPSAVVSSSVIDWRPWLTQMIKSISSGKYQSFTYDATFENGGMNVTPFDGPSAKYVSPALRKQFASMLKQLRSGKTKLPLSKAHAGYR